MITLNDFRRYLDGYLCFDEKMNPAIIDPYMANGMLIAGREAIKTVGFGVSASISLFDKANKEHCDAIIVHHSFNLPPVNRYDKIFQQRMGYLMKNDISLFGYHFLLDAHPEIGNNTEILRVIGTSPVRPYFFHRVPWGWIGSFKSPVTFEEITEKLKNRLSPRTIMYPYGKKSVQNVVALSGKGAPTSGEMQQLIDQNIDLYITGEIHEWNRELFREARINCIAGGHYHTEVFGISALMNKIKQKYPDVTVKWLDIENEV